MLIHYGKSSLIAILAIALVVPSPAAAKPEFNLGLGYVHECPLAEDESEMEYCYHGVRGQLLVNFIFRGQGGLLGNLPDHQGFVPSHAPIFVGAIELALMMVMWGVTGLVLSLFSSGVKMGVFYEHDIEEGVGSDDGDDLATYRAMKGGLQVGLYLIPDLDIQVHLATAYVNADYFGDEQDMDEGGDVKQEGFTTKFGVGYVPSPVNSGLFILYEFEKTYFGTTRFTDFAKKSEIRKPPKIKDSGTVMLGWTTAI